jgi:transducin (beta)-like 1
MSISSDEINFLIFRYLQENGFSHSAFTFAYESLVTKSSVAQVNVPPGALITFLQKGLEYVGIEEHINGDGSVRAYDGEYSLLSPFICEAVATKDDRRVRRVASNINASLQTENKDDDKNVSSDNLKLRGGGVAKRSSSAMVKVEGFSRLLKLHGHQGEVFICVWSPITHQLASGSADGICRLWSMIDMDQDKWAIQDKEVPLSNVVMPHSAYIGEKFKDVTSIIWSPDGKSLGTGCYDGTTRIWDNSGQLKLTLKTHTGPVFSMKWNSRGNLLLTGSYDKRVIVWDVGAGTAIKTYVLHKAPVLDVDWKDSDTFAVCSSDTTISICQVSSIGSSSQRVLKGHKNEVNSICWSPSGQYLASCSDDYTAKIWAPADHQISTNDCQGLKFDLVGHKKEIYTIRWVNAGPGSSNPSLPLQVCTASFDGSVRIWEMVRGTSAHVLRRHERPVYAINPSPDGLYLAAGSLGGFVSVWRLSDGAHIRETRGGGDTFDVSWSHDGRMLSSCFSCGTLQVIDMEHVDKENATDSGDVVQTSRMEIDNGEDRVRNGNEDKGMNSCSGNHIIPGSTGQDKEKIKNSYRDKKSSKLVTSSVTSKSSNSSTSDVIDIKSLKSNTSNGSTSGSSGGRNSIKTESISSGSSSATDSAGSSGDGSVSATAKTLRDKESTTTSITKKRKLSSTDTDKGDGKEQADQKNINTTNDSVSSATSASGSVLESSDKKDGSRKKFNNTDGAIESDVTNETASSTINVPKYGSNNKDGNGEKMEDKDVSVSMEIVTEQKMESSYSKEAVSKSVDIENKNEMVTRIGLPSETRHV